MHRIFIPLVCIILTFTINVSSYKLLTENNEDSLDLTLLLEKFWSLKPLAFKKVEPLILCQFIDQCCSNDNRFEAISSLVFLAIKNIQNKNYYETVINKCVNATTLNDAYEFCPSLKHLISPITQQDKFDTIQYMNIITDYYTQPKNLIELVYNSCIDEEIHAFFCLSNTTLVHKCVNEILEELHNNLDLKSYENFINQTRKTLLDLIIQLHLLVSK